MLNKREENLKQPENLRVIISGGGTGGHIFPALAIANAVKCLKPETEFLFVGAEGKMEMEKVPAAGYRIEGLKISGLKREFSLDNLSFPIKVISSLIKAGKIIQKFKPHVAVGVGGYASGPLLYMAARKQIPTVIQEQNSFPGITNKLLAAKAIRICVAYEGMQKYFPEKKIVLTGNPVRKETVDIKSKREEAFRYFSLDENKKTILVIGGSQGARTINKSIASGLNIISDAGLQLIWQTGKMFLPEAEKLVEQTGNNKLKPFDFISRMDFAYAAADIVLSRAGASTVSELCIIGKPSIMVPLPTAAEDHQTKNIMALVIKDAAIMVKDSEAQQKLVNEALALINNPDKQRMLSENILKMALPDSAEIIAKEVIHIAGF